MQVIEKMPSDVVGASAKSSFVNAVAVMLGVAVLVCICMATNAPGVDMSAGFF